jgi:hypothetical protein
LVIEKPYVFCEVGSEFINVSPPNNNIKISHIVALPGLISKFISNTVETRFNVFFSFFGTCNLKERVYFPALYFLSHLFLPEGGEEYNLRTFKD